MNNEQLPSSDSPDPVARASDLLQLLYENEISEEQLVELNTLWDEHPRIEADSRKNDDVEQMLCFLRDSQTRLSPMLLEELKSSALVRFADRLSSSPSADDPFFDQHGMEDISFEQLVRFEKIAPAINVPSLVDEEELRIETARKKEKSDRRQRMGFRIVLAVNVFLVLGIVFEIVRINFHVPSDSPAVPIARILEAIDVEWEDGAENLKVGAETGRNRIAIRSGVLQVEFFSGARVILEGPTELVLQSDREAFCRQGKISVHVPPKAAGFEISTPFTSVVDLGTEFSLEVTEDRAEVHVLKGAVEINRLATAPKKLLQGSAARIRYSGEPEEMQADRNTYYSEQELFVRSIVSREKKQEQVDRFEEKLENDASLLFRLGSPDNNSTNRKIVGYTASYGHRSRPRIWEHRGKNDRIELEMPEENPSSLTLIFFVRLQSLDHIGRLLIGNDFYERPGSILWQIAPGGNLQFHVHAADRNGFTTFDAPAIFPKSYLKTWTMLAVTVDAERKTVTHYVDGRKKAGIPWKKPIPLHLGELTAGNDVKMDKNIRRYFDADVGELLIFKRSLDGDEILEIYEALDP